MAIANAGVDVDMCNEFGESAGHMNSLSLWKVEFTRFYKTTWGFLFLGRGGQGFFQGHSKGLYKDPNDCMNHPE